MAAPILAKVAIKVVQSKTGRRIIAGILIFVVALVLLPVFLIGGMLTMMGGGAAASCPPLEATDGFSTEQLGNAQTIKQVATELEVSEDGLKIALMVGLVESGMLNLANSTVPESLTLPYQGEPGKDHDSVGVFQQRTSSGWGTVAELMNPTFASKAFFGGPSGPNGGSPRGLLDIDGWESKGLGEAAQAVQVSAVPDAYDKKAGKADELLQILAKSTPDCPSENTGGVPPTVVGGWANPVGMQPWGTYPQHAGGAMDVHVGIGTPVYAPAAGTIFDLSESCGGTVIGVQHDVQYTTAFAHLSGMAVRPGQQVVAGQLIGYSGASGSCVDGAHLHFEVRVGPNPTNWGSFTPAYKFMREVGVTMGPCMTGCTIYPM